LKKQRLNPIDSSTRSHQDKVNNWFIDVIDSASDYLPNQLRLRWRQCSRLGSHHIRTIVDSLKSKHTLDWLCITWGQLGSFKLVEDTSNRLRAHSDYHSVLNDGSYDQLEQDVNDVYWIKESSVTHWWDTNVYKIKIKVIGWSFYIEHITNPVTSVKKDVEQEDKATILSKIKLISLVRTEALIGDWQSVGSPIGNRSSLGLMTCSGASDDISIFAWTRGPLKIKDQTCRTTHKDVEPNKQHMKSSIVTLG
jgi:hypothetical protein